MGVSYPTVKKMLSDVLANLGFEDNDDINFSNNYSSLTKQEF